MSDKKEIWNIKRKDGTEVLPREYSTGVKQNEIVEEILENFKSNDIVLLEGGAGSGKSIIGMLVASQFDKAVCVVPTRRLQDQYMSDFNSDNARFIIMKKEKELVINTWKGKNNFLCNLHKDKNANDVNNECNKPKYKCEHKVSLFDSDFANNICYDSIYQPNQRIYYNENETCPYYEQFLKINKTDVLILNGAKFEVEMFLAKRLPKANLLIIDEKDGFLDNLAIKMEVDVFNIRKNIDKILSTVEDDNFSGKELTILNFLDTELAFIKNKIQQNKILLDEPYPLKNENINLNNIMNALIKLKELEKFKTFAKDSIILQKDLESCFFSIKKRVLTESERKKDTFNLDNEDDTYIITLFTLNVSSRLKEIFQYFDKVLLMTATPHSKKVLNELFEIDPVLVYSEKMFQGNLTIANHLSSFPCSYSVLKQQGRREIYLKMLNEICKDSVNKKRQTLVQVVSYSDLPTFVEKSSLNLLLPTPNELKGRNPIFEMDKFLSKEKMILFSTNDRRGTDLPDDKCDCIILTKLTYPNYKEPYYVALRNKNKQLEQEIYQDKTIRELKQAITRGLRHSNDKVVICSPDSRATEMIIKEIKKDAEKHTKRLKDVKQ